MVRWQDCHDRAEDPPILKYLVCHLNVKQFAIPWLRLSFSYSERVEQSAVSSELQFPIISLLRASISQLVMMILSPTGLLWESNATKWVGKHFGNSRISMERWAEWATVHLICAGEPTRTCFVSGCCFPVPGVSLLSCSPFDTNTKWIPLSDTLMLFSCEA